MNANNNQVVRWIKTLNTRPIGGEKQEYKTLLILAVIQILEDDPKHENDFKYSELLEVFKSKFPAKVDFQESRFSNPYFRLSSDNIPIQVWLLQPPGGAEKVSRSDNCAAVKYNCPSVKINETVWEGFLNPDGQSMIKDAINERFYPAETQASLFDKSNAQASQNAESTTDVEDDLLKQVLKDLTTESSLDSTSDEGSTFEDGINDLDDTSSEILINTEYPLEKIFKLTNIEIGTLEKWVKLLNRKKQIIFYGPPGTGKTFIAQQIAKHLIGEGNGFQELIQFHPSFAYEDFIQGIRPQLNQDGLVEFQNVQGRFLEFCSKARNRGCCVLIIDEINRANLSNVFGELLYLLEYRNEKVHLSSGITFGIPNNVRIIGTMNTADRSIALVDYALRRRFAFIELSPDYDLLKKFHEKHETNFPVKNLIEVLKNVNATIADSKFSIGISFFMSKELADHIEEIWMYEIEPYLEEYFFSRPRDLDDFRWGKISSNFETEGNSTR